MPTLTQKSQVTIPKKIRVQLGLRPGDEVEFDVKASGIILHKARKKLPIEKLRGILGKGNTDEIMAELR